MMKLETFLLLSLRSANIVSDQGLSKNNVTLHNGRQLSFSNKNL